MASRKQDLLGKLIDTSLVEDYDPMDDPFGRFALIIPAKEDISDDTEEDEAFDALSDDLSPGEASAVVETMRPLSTAENKILDETPGLKGLTRVDDAEQEKWLLNRSAEGYKAMDNVLDDAVYGETDKALAQIGYDSDMGWGIPGLSSLRKVGRMAYGGVRRAVSLPTNVARRAAGTAFGIARAPLRMIPGSGMIPGLAQGGQSAPPPAYNDYPQDQYQQADQYQQPYEDPYAGQYDSQGESDINHREEALERLGLDSDLGFSIPGLSSVTNLAKKGLSFGTKVVSTPFQQAYKYGKKGAQFAYKGAKYALNKMEALALYPIRKVVNAFKSKMVGRKAQEIARQRGLAKPGPAENAAALSWAKTYTAKANPKFGKLVASMMGHQEDEMGLAPVVLYPLIVVGAVVLAKILESIYNSAFSRGSAAAQPMDPNYDPTMDPNYDPSLDPNANPYGQYPDPSSQYIDPASQYADPSAQYADPYAQSDPYAQYNDPYASQGENMTGINGEDSLGAFATEILGSTAPSKATSMPSAKADELVNLGVTKLRSGKPLTPGEVSIIATLAEEGHPHAKRVYAVLQKEGIPVPNSTSGAWAHMLNPTYWFKSTEEKSLIDKEKDKWNENAELQKQLAKKQEVLNQAERAKSAVEAVEAAKAQAAATDAQLKAIESSLRGEFFPEFNADINGAFVGHEKPTAVTEVVMAALDKVGKKETAQILYKKIAAGESLSPEELKDARRIARLLSKVKVVHGDLMEGENDPINAMHGAFVGACILGNIATAKKVNGECQKSADALSQRLASGTPATDSEKKAAAKLVEHTKKLREFTKSHVTGAAFVGLDNAKSLRKSAFIGATKVMSPADKKMLSAITKLAQAGNPRAIKGLALLKKSGEVMAGDFIGNALGDIFKAVTMPITVPLKYMYKGAKWTGQQLGIVSKGGAPSPEQVRLAKLRAARQRSLAAQAKARAADAQTQAELRAQEAIASAADAEADAADAEALSKEAAIRTAEVEANPDMAYNEEDSSGAFVGSWEEFVGYDPASKDPFETPAQKKATVKAAHEKKLIAKAKEKSATGMKIRSGATLYAKAKKGDKKADAAIRTMVAKAKKGDKQALLDVQAVKAGRKAVIAREKAQKREARVLAAKARKAKVIAIQRKYEARIANKLVRMERKHDLKKLGAVERKAASGNPKARAYVQAQVAAAKKGDKKAQKRVLAMQLTKKVRLATPTKRERRNLVAAQKLVTHAHKGNPKAVRQIRVLAASAKAGNPNAKRAMARLALASAVTTTVATGVIAGTKKGKKAKMTRQDHAAVVAQAQIKKASGTASREELNAAAKSAQALGDKKAAGELALAANNTPSATENLKRTATVVAAKEAGNPEAKAAIVESLNAAKAGEQAGIQKTAGVVAVQTLDDLNKGKEISPTMRDAINLNERINARDPSAVAEAQKITEAATAPNPIPEATMAAVGLTAAVALDKALANKPKAKAQLMDKVNPPLSQEEKTVADAKLNELVAKAHDGTITAEEGLLGVHLASRLNKPKVAATIAAEAPPYDDESPLSSLPDMPLAPITGPWDAFKESLRALTFSTRDPLANYRGGVAARSRIAPAAEPVTTSGWSPFDIFRKYAQWIAPVAASAAAAASIANLVDRKKADAARAAAPAPAAAPAAAQAPAATVQTVSAPAASKETPAAESKGETPPLPSDVEKRVRKEIEDSILPPEPTQVASKTDSKKKKGQPHSFSLGADKSFKDYMQEAIKAKKISKGDFNSTVALSVGKNSTKEKQLIAAEKILKFLLAKGVKVEQ